MRELYELMAPCHFGLEAVLKREILDLGYEISSVEDGRVTFLGGCRGDRSGEYFPAQCRAYPAEGWLGACNNI